MVQFWLKRLHLLIGGRDNSSVGGVLVLRVQGPGFDSLDDVYHIYGSGGASLKLAKAI